ncbi:MAG: transcriptional regulator, partial [Acidimicrobiia bacterium]
MTTATTFDKERAKAFLNQMVSVMNGGAMALMCSLGNRTGLFDVMSTLPPSTAEDIAKAAELHVRPVQEWL